jgi:hypothetical protein
MLIMILYLGITQSVVYNASASCYGDYQNILAGGSIVQSGIGNYIAGMLLVQL